MADNTYIEKQLQEAAAKICDYECIACFNCGKSKERAINLPLCGTNIVCPLQKYNVDHSKAPKDMLARLMNEPTVGDCNLLCQFCEHRDKSKDTADSMSLESCFSSHCIACPVEMCREGIEETMAEGRMS